MKHFKILILFFCFFFSLVFNSYSQIISQIKFNGNKYVQREALLSKINFIPNKDYNDQELNLIQKVIFETGFFKSLDFKVLGNVLVINLVENPIIDFLYVYGDKNKERVEKIYDLIQLKTGNLFSEHKLLQDISTISKLYKYSGYYDVKVEPLIKLIDNNKVNIAIKVTKNNKYKINKIFFIGNKIFSSKVLLDVVSSSENSWFKFLSSSKLLNEDRVEYDRQLLKLFYLDEGYYDVQVLFSKIDIKQNYSADIIHSIDAGKKYSFGSVNYDKLNFFNQNDQKNLLKIKNKISNKVYSRKKVVELRDEISQIIISNKKINLDFNVVQEKTLDKINLNILFSETKLPIVKNITVRGNSITEEKVIRNNLIFSEGDTYSSYKQEKSKDNLQSINIFKTSKIAKETLSDNTVEVTVDVEEKPTGSIMGGVGVSSNEAAISFSVSEQNLFGSNILVNSELSIGTQKVLGNLLVVNPDYNNTGRLVRNNFYAQQTNYDSVGYDSSSIGDDISTSYDIYEDISLKVGFGIDYDKISTSPSASAVYKNQEGNYKTLKTFYEIANDKRNRRFQTTSGHIVGFGQSISLPVSDIAYLSNTIYGKYYKSLGKDYTLNVKSGFSTINGYNSDNVKLSNRLFVSSKQLRGFEPRKIGPVDGVDHIGGNYSLYGGVSSTFPNPLPEKWNATTLLFLDAGNVWGVDYDSSKDSDKVRSSVGVALDWVSPLGPISFSLSNAISKASTDDDQTFSFQIGSTF